MSLTALVFSFCLCLPLSGCLSLPAVPSSLLMRYQEAMVNRPRAGRVGTEGLDLLKPAATKHLPPLDVKFIEDPETHEALRAVIELSLDEAVRRALVNSLDIAVVSFDPAISREQMLEAAAEFDVVFFADFTYASDNEQVATTFEAGESKTRTWEAGLTQKTVTGATWAASWTMTRTWDNSAFSTLAKRYEPMLLLEVSQPLLRDAWGQFNLANLRLARINHQITVAQFRQKVENVITEVIGTYWVLVQARREVQIQEDLLSETNNTLRRVEARGDLDATAVQIRQAEAAAADRSARVIRAQKLAQDVQDALGRLMADEQLNLLSGYEIVPTTEPIDQLVQLDETDQLLSALQFNPLLEQAREGIAAADIRVRVAKNQRLPRLDLTASGSFVGLSANANEAHENMGSLDYASYRIGIRLEYPLGNRVLRSRLRRAKLSRLQAIADLQNTADLIAQQVRERIRQVRSTHREFQAHRKAAQAAREQLTALKDVEELRGRLTPEFLQVKLAAQESIAASESAEMQALISHNTALVELARATGTVLELNRVKVAIPTATGPPDPRTSDNIFPGETMTDRSFLK